MADRHVPETFGGRLRNLRERAGLAQGELAGRAGVSVRALRDIERDRVVRPQSRTVQALVAALGLTQFAAESVVGPDDAACQQPPTLEVLGPLRLWRGRLPIEITSQLARTLLGLLALHPNQTVSRDHIIDVLWAEQVPRTWQTIVHGSVSRLRGLLEPDRTRRRPGRVLALSGNGYRLNLDPAHVDLARFDAAASQAARAEAANDRRAAFGLLEQALRCWRGPVLADAHTRLRQHPAALAAGGRRLAATLAYADVAMDVGSCAAAVGRLENLLHEEPLHEGLAARLMLALAGCGRQAAALALFDRLRARLADELGVQPGVEVREAHLRVLRGEVPAALAGPVRPAAQLEPVLAPLRPARPEPAAESAPDVTSGCQLPADLPDHTNRDPEIGRIMGLLSGSTVNGIVRPVVILSGSGGIGKTSLSIHVAHLLRPDYPEGQIFISLCGGTAGTGGVPPGEVLSRVLGALGTPNLHRFRTVEDKLARYRAAISGKRILIVLDDVATADMIRPLIPGTPGPALILSTRARLTTIPGAEHVELRMLIPAESLLLLRRIVGDAKVAAEPAAAATLVGMCNGLPLALRIVGARLAARPHWPISRLVQRMNDERRRLDEMTADGLAVRISIAVTYQGLAPAARRMLRLLGFLGVPEFGDWLAVALVDGPIDIAEDLLEQLVDARLVDIDEGANRLTRFRMHDLVRLYAHERAVEEDPDATLRLAVDRVVGVAIDLVERQAERIPYAVPRLRRRPSLPATVEASVVAPDERPLGWVQTERACLVSVVERATALGMDEAACVLADALVFAAFALHNDFDDWNRAHAAARAAARANGNRTGEAVVECGIGLLRYKEDRFADARQSFAVATSLFEATGDEMGAAVARCGQGTALREVGQHQAAVPLLEQALHALDRNGDRNGAAHAAYGLGYSHRELGNDDTALGYLEQAVAMYRSLDHWRGEAIAIRGIGLVHRARGDLDSAGAWCGRAHDLVVAHGDPHLSCYTAQGIAKVWIRQGDLDRAREPLVRSLAACRDLHDRLGIALIVRTLGEMHLAAGRIDAALSDLALAHTAWKEIDHSLGQARTLRDMGAAHAMAGDCAAAHIAWRAAWATFAELGTREAAELSTWRKQWGCACDPTPLPYVADDR
jgi:DNA-binding SARP family transcriptional activator/tetratricopeptide (TPR) repeat protein/DNA-binding XRE family transcriptional regulator